MAALQRLAAPTARALRSGEVTTVEAAALAIGDVILLDDGDCLPADVRIFESVNLEVDEAILTGESLPVAKTTAPVAEAEIPLGDRTNLAFKGCTVTQGRGRALVVRIGAETEIGKIAASIAVASKKKATPLQRRMNLMAWSLFIFAGFLAIAVFGANKFKADSPTILYAVSVAVAIIPEGLVAVVTITLAYGMNEMSKKKVRCIVCFESGIWNTL